MRIRLVESNQLRDGYQAALANNPDLKFGQYVAATGSRRISETVTRISPQTRSFRDWRAVKASARLFRVSA
ncbi:MAG TPA: hypothetical protein VFY40_10120 [Blastocatellia bacterium]|nr:hypothetical protein [Blastocatellia bacterium]